MNPTGHDWPGRITNSTLGEGDIARSAHVAE